MSENGHDALKAFPEFITESRGEIFIKVITVSLVSIFPEPYVHQNPHKPYQGFIHTP